MKKLSEKHKKVLKALEERFDYTEDGFLFSKYLGKKLTGTMNPNGYLKLKISGVQILYHQAIFLKINKFLPQSIDHANQLKTDNRIENLRGCSQSYNLANRKFSLGSSKYKGVTKSGKKFRSSIYKDKKKHHLGMYDNEKDAAIAYDVKAKELFGNFALTNF